MASEDREKAINREGALTKMHLAEAIANDTGLSPHEAGTIVELIFDSIVHAVHGGVKVEIRGFGTFISRRRQPRRGRNPKTGATVAVPAKRVAAFRASKKMLRDLNGASGV
jgi:integration host factor subunit beta